MVLRYWEGTICPLLCCFYYQFAFGPRSFLLYFIFQSSSINWELCNSFIIIRILKCHISCDFPKPCCVAPQFLAIKEKKEEEKKPIEKTSRLVWGRGWTGQAKYFLLQKILGPCKVPERLRLWTVIVTFYSYYSRVCHMMGARYTLVPWMNECLWTSNIVSCTKAVPHWVTRSLFLQKVHSDFFLNAHLGWMLFDYGMKRIILVMLFWVCIDTSSLFNYRGKNSLLHHVAGGFRGLDFTQSSKDCVGLGSCS